MWMFSEENQLRFWTSPKNNRIETPLSISNYEELHKAGKISHNTYIYTETRDFFHLDDRYSNIGENISSVI